MALMLVSLVGADCSDNIYLGPGLIQGSVLE